MAKKGQTLKKIAKLLDRHVEQYDRLLGLLDHGARRALTAGDAERPSEADLHFRLDRVEAEAVERARDERAFREDVLTELRRHNDLLAAIVKPAAKPAAPKQLEAAKPARKEPPKPRARR
jgi:hypothetical protein